MFNFLSLIFIHKNAVALLMLVLLSRIIALLVFDQWDVINDSGLAIKPFGNPAYLDYEAYRLHIHSAWGEFTRPFLFLQYVFIDIEEAWEWLHRQKFKPGPLFPELLKLWGYEENRTPLALLYLLFGCGLGWVWALFMAWRKMGFIMQVLASCFPALLYYSFLVSTDLLYAVFMAIFYDTKWAVILRKQGAWIWCMCALLLSVLIRPNALSMIPILFIVLALDSTMKCWTKLIFLILWSLISLYMFIYYLPYFWLYERHSEGLAYWGINSQQFHEGFFSDWPIWLNQAMSIVLFGLSKLTYSVGLRPSYAELSFWLTFARACPAVLLLPGLIYGFFRGHWFDRIFVFFFLLPLYFGAAQERYLLAVTPILMLWGSKFYITLWNNFNPKYYKE
jgi:hypothetical protein